ncbi:MAG TPA: SET domain-containing protein-lysine N-methyltransferase [Rhodanobacteraceae bacterium]
MPRRFVVRHSAIHGNGVFAATDIPSHTVLLQYKGRLLTDAAADRLYPDGADTGHTFLFTLNDRYIVDANVGGNSARWINHSCAPNCEAYIDEVDGGRKDRVMIQSLRAIKAGEELTYNYGIVLDVPQTARLKRIWACRCGSRHCTGTILQPKR